MICGRGDYNSANSINELAELVRYDLLALGYTNILLLDSVPATNESDELICLRRISNNADDKEYHFMLYDYETDAWYHKPGNTAVLKYTDNGGIPSDSVNWYTEMSHSGVEHWQNIIYTSDIVFIKYSKLFGVPFGQSIGACAEFNGRLYAKARKQYAKHNRRNDTVAVGHIMTCNHYIVPFSRLCITNLTKPQRFIF
jgi:hypothetical protein